MVQENLKTVRERIEAACRRVGRDPDEVTLIAVSKTKPVEMMREAVSLGLFIGLGGAVTFKNAVMPPKVASAVPLDRLLLEPDAPYMTPVPFRGKRCDSSYISYTAQKIAGLRGIDVNALYQANLQNTATLFGIQMIEP